VPNGGASSRNATFLGATPWAQAAGGLEPKLDRIPPEGARAEPTTLGKEKGRFAALAEAILERIVLSTLSSV
jgi:hypothetical protein